jgi:hypothetical protein
LSRNRKLKEDRRQKQRRADERQYRHIEMEHRTIELRKMRTSRRIPQIMLRAGWPFLPSLRLSLIIRRISSILSGFIPIELDSPAILSSRSSNLCLISFMSSRILPGTASGKLGSECPIAPILLDIPSIAHATSSALIIEKGSRQYHCANNQSRLNPVRFNPQTIGRLFRPLLDGKFKRLCGRRAIIYQDGFHCDVVAFTRRQICAPASEYTESTEDPTISEGQVDLLNRMKDVMLRNCEGMI